MPYETYPTEAAFRSQCEFWGAIENKLNALYQPNPWIFETGYRLLPGCHEYKLIYRNFDGSKKLSFTVLYENGILSFHHLQGAP